MPEVLWLLEHVRLWVDPWSFEIVLIANSYTLGSSKGNICVLHTPKSNHKHSISMATTPPIVNNNYCTPFAAISQNADGKHQVNCSNFGTIGKLTI